MSSVFNVVFNYFKDIICVSDEITYVIKIGWGSEVKGSRAIKGSFCNTSCAHR